MRDGGGNRDRDGGKGEKGEARERDRPTERQTDRGVVEIWKI